MSKQQVAQTVDPHPTEPRNSAGSPVARFHIPLEGGWKEHTYYVVDIALTSHNVVHRAILFVGFLDGKPDEPLSGGYTCVMNATYEGNERPDRAHYIKAICEIPEMSRTKYVAS